MTVQNRRTLDRMTEEAVFQAKRADTVAGEIKPLAEEVNRVETHLASLRATLTAKQDEMVDASTQAQDLREMVEEKCAAKNWPLPEAAAVLNLRNTDTFPAIPADAPRTAQQIREAVDDLAEPPFNVRDIRCACPEPDCPVHGGGSVNGRGDAPSEPEPAEHTHPDPTPERKAEARARTPWALLLALYVRLLLTERDEGRHAGRRRRVFKRRALVEIV